MNKYKKYLKKLIKKEQEIEERKAIEDITKINYNELMKEGKTIINLKRKIIKNYPKDCKVMFTSSEEIHTIFNLGDKVLISGKNGIEKNVTGIINHIDDKTIVINNVNKSIKDNDFNKCRIDLLVKNTTYNRQIKNLESNSCNKILNLLLKKSVPKKDNKNSDISFFDNHLNKYQKLAVKKSLNCGSFFLIQGPPGTGKTKTLTELIKQEVKRENTILVTAESNTAIDNLGKNLINSNINMTRIGNYKKISNEIKQYSLETKFKNHKLYSKLKKMKENKIIYNPTDISSLEEKINTSIINNSNIILATNSSSAMHELKGIIFDVTIVDEAAQSTIPSILIPLSKSKRFILAGDHKQLPPTTNSTSNELKISLFEKFFEQFPHQHIILKKQYRMNNMLMQFPNQEFYNNTLICDKSICNSTIQPLNNGLDNGKSLIFIDTAKVEYNQESSLNKSNSYINKLETEITINFVNDYLNSDLKKEDMGIITNYSDQVKLIQNKTSVEVKTVDSFQGREKEVIIISTVRSNNQRDVGFLNEPRRLNVALTRAKKKLIIIGNSETLCSEHIFKELFDFCEKNNSIVHLNHINKGELK